MGLAPFLRRNFNTLEKVDELIHNGVWNNIVSPKNKENLSIFNEFCSRQNSSYYMVTSGKCYLLKERPCDTASYCFEGDDGIVIENKAIVFDSLDRAKNQDVSYVYEFFPETGKWKTHK